jgi:hypothetical protein
VFGPSGLGFASGQRQNSLQRKVTMMTCLSWVNRIQAIAQTGLTYAKDVYDLERYEQLRDLAIEIGVAHLDRPTAEVAALVASEKWPSLATSSSSSVNWSGAKRSPIMKLKRSVFSPRTGSRPCRWAGSPSRRSQGCSSTLRIHRCPRILSNRTPLVTTIDRDQFSSSPSSTEARTSCPSSRCWSKGQKGRVVPRG